MEDRIGTLEPGKKADIAILDRDLRVISAREVLDTQILATVVDGKFVYEGHQRPNRAAEIPTRPSDACACRKFARPVA
jgi:cytosine/adenosine deaminase-related metal-dependent hydrolase